MLRIEAMKSEALLIKIISEKRFFSKNRKRLGKKGSSAGLSDSTERRYPSRQQRYNIMLMVSRL